MMGASCSWRWLGVLSDGEVEDGGDWLVQDEWWLGCRWWCWGCRCWCLGCRSGDLEGDPVGLDGFVAEVVEHGE